MSPLLRRRVAVIGIRGIPARSGGFETCVEETAKRLVALGHDVTVYCRRAVSEERPRTVFGVRCVYVPTIHTKNLSTIVSTFFASLHAICTRVEVVHLYVVGTALFIPLLKLAGKRVVISVDALDWKRKKWSGPASLYLRLAAWMAVRFADELVIDSKVIQDYYRDRFGRPGAFVPFGANVEPAAGTAAVESRGLTPGKYVLFVGVLRPEKQVDKLIRAFTAVQQDAFDLAIVGDDPFEREYEQTLRQLANHRVKFLGRIYGPDVIALYQHAYLYVTVSEVEGTSPALLTAMAAGRCVVVNGIPENLETIDDAGLSYPVNDIARLSALLTELFGQPDRVREYGRRALERVRRVYDWNAVTGRLARLYDDVCRGTARTEGE